MKVLDSSNTTHNFKVVPRNYILGDKSLQLYNEETDVFSDEDADINITDGYIEVSFDKVVLNNASYQIKIYDSITNNIYYRGKLFFTNQSDIQNFRITNDYFTL